MREIKKILGLQLKSPQQIHGRFEADCEILKIKKDLYLATTIDSIAEEITEGLYLNPESWGWMTAAVTLSDLAASGARPLGLTFSTQWKFGTRTEKKQRFYKGVRACLGASRVPLLGGDSGSALDSVFTSSGMAISSVKPLTRLGIAKGDLICLLDRRKLGIGPALAFEYLLAPRRRILTDRDFRPSPQPWNVHRLRKFFHASIDTSDGLGLSLLILSQLNGVGFDVFWNKDVFSPKALHLCERHKIPPTMLLLGDHGDFQTLVAVKKKHFATVKRHVLVVAEATPAPGVYLRRDGVRTQLPVHRVSDCPRDLGAIRKLFLELRRELATMF